jgi:hypothetical protein
MVVLPDSAKDAFRGVSKDISDEESFITFLSSADVATPIWIIPVAKAGNRLREQPME